MAKAVIQKKFRKNPFEELSLLLDIPDLEQVFPRRHLESWRRFDPLKLLPVMSDSARHGISPSKITLTEPDSAKTHFLTNNLKTANEWKKQDEVFLQKARNHLKHFKTNNDAAFFENLITKSVSEDHLHILKLSKNETHDQIPAIEISASHPEHLNFHIFYIYAEESSKASINLVKKSGACDMAIIYVFQEKNSDIRLRYLDENSQPSQAVHFIKYHQEIGSTSKSGIYSICASQNKKIFIENNLLQGAVAEFSGLFLGRYSHVDNDFLVNHAESFSRSSLLFKMSTIDESYGIFWGNVEIAPNTRGCEAYQQNKNLILGNNSRVDAIPRLAIHTENVLAAHGSATGEISEDEIFYMMSRGLGYAEARKLLLRGFFEDVLRKSFEHDPDQPDLFLERIWLNIQKILGDEISL